MKFTTAAAAVAAYGMTLLSSSASAADARKTSKLRADDAVFHRRAEFDAEEDAMSMPTDDAKNHWGLGVPVCVPSPTKCFGRQYYRVLTGKQLTPSNYAAMVPWMEFYDNTPKNCVLAPIHSGQEWNELFAEGSAFNSGDQSEGDGKPGNLWVGITKAAELVTSGTGSESDWYNLDGTPVPNNSVFWSGSTEPNNEPAGQTRAHLYYFTDGTTGTPNKDGKLRDLNPRGNKGPNVNAAIYKCCDDSVVTFTPEYCGPHSY